MHAGGGVDAFLEDHGVIVMADHSHAGVERTINLTDAFADFHVLAPGRAIDEDAEIAACPAQRSAMLYVLFEQGKGELVPRLASAARELEGDDLVMWLAADEDVIARGDGERRFAPGGYLNDPRGSRWSVKGELVVLGGARED